MTPKDDNPNAATSLPTLGGAVALVADLFGEAELVGIRQRCSTTNAVVRHGDGWQYTAWPLAVDAALATLTAQALVPTHPDLGEYMDAVLMCDRDAAALRELFAEVHERFVETLMELQNDQNAPATVPFALAAPRSFVLAHLGAADGTPAYHVHRGQIPPATHSTAELIRWAIAECALQPRTITKALLEWAPRQAAGNWTPKVPPDPIVVAARCAAIHKIADACVNGYGLEVTIRPKPADGDDLVEEVNALYEAVPVLEVIVIRDDLERADDESAQASILEERLMRAMADASFAGSRTDPWPFTVRGEYIK